MAIGGIDIGGTKLGVCLAHADGSIIAAEEVPLDAAASPETIMDDAAARLDRLADTSGQPAEAVGIACPGPFDRDRQCFLRPPNLTSWHGFELGNWCRDRFGSRSYVMNDANAAAVSEWLWGGHRDAKVLVFLTCSTGLGAGIVIEGRLLEGARGMAGEVGRIRLADDGPVGFGHPGTAEGFGSGTGLRQLAQRERIRAEQNGEPTSLTAADDLDAKSVCRLADEGDPAALRAIDDHVLGLGRLIAILANVLAPDRVVLGTIPAAYPGLIMPRLPAAIAQSTTAVAIDSMTIAPTSLTNRWQLQAIAPAVYAERDGAQSLQAERPKR